MLAVKMKIKFMKTVSIFVAQNTLDSIIPDAICYLTKVGGSERYLNFLSVLGERIELVDWKEYAGGLDTSPRNGSFLE